ncbi:origin recognition complex subunit 1 [Magnaporthiopsis poae ATCC 64411]|uniref:Origin recognition complex subunit 1 n=1 Tax=Magnaporthiopsis poae (strain ATCC 64411 / 73-15) TaxID=644358 RepID=A0A0C4E702_MAGP6|nr:origin recognition complex subunit 1 [Magnaporthiopsis poae ATCC 64411]
MSDALPKPKRNKKPIPGVLRDDSDDELGDDDLPWEWIYDGVGPAGDSNGAAPDPSLPPPGEPSQDAAANGAGRRKRKRAPETPEYKIVGARMGKFECRLGDTVLLKADGSNEAWVGLICDFVEDDGDEGEKAAHFMWFSTEREIRNKEKKRTDAYWNELYITPSWDTNPLTTINGKATVMSQESFLAKYPSGKVPRNSREFGKVFVCRRGCNTRTASYTDEFVWEDIFRGTAEDVHKLIERVKTGTKATRARRKAKEPSPDVYDFSAAVDDDDDDDGAKKLQRTPKKPRKMASATTPSRARGANKPVTPSSHRRIVVKKHLEFTPLAMRTLSPSQVQGSPFQLARTQLHVASVPTSLPCRESEFSEVYAHLEAAITEGAGSCIYISGTPGTGKTATVREVVSRLDDAVRHDELDDFIFVEINGMKVSDPHQAYSLLWEALRGQRVSPAQALDLLEREFSNPSPRRVPCVVLMDELDQLVTKNQGVMYNFFNWPGLRHSRLIVLAVANTMDLPERTLSNKISSRLALTGNFQALLVSHSRDTPMSNS